MPKKNIWFVNKEAAPSTEFATHMRTVRQAQFFQEKGYSVKVFCSSVVHNSNVEHRFEGKIKEEMHDGIPMVFVKCPKYGKSSLKRVLAFFIFSVNLFKAKSLGKPDIIIHESKTPFDILVYWFAKKYKARYIVDIEDLWPFELEHFGFFSKGNPLLKMLYRMERWLYAHCEHVVVSQEGCHEYIKEHKWDIEHCGPIDLNRIHYVNNGTSLAEFDDNKAKYVLDDADLKDSSFKLIYLGSIRLANNLDRLIDAAKLLLPYKDIKILIYGNGTERESLEVRCRKEKVENVFFKDKWIELQYVPFVLSRANVNLLNYAPNWAPYGGSMNKMVMAFASGKPIICNAGMPYSEIQRHNIGIDKAFINDQEYANAILSIYYMNQQGYNEMCYRVREVAKRYDAPYLCEQFANYCSIPI